MLNSMSLAQELRHRATEYARRASVAQDFAVESAYRQLSRHCLMRATELERVEPPKGAAPSEEKTLRIRGS